MKELKRVTGRVAVLDRPDIDTDQIIPKQFLKRIERTGFGEFLFFDWAKEPGWDLPPNPILTAGRNFGCGSSREHAAWALSDFGFRCVIAPTFADIFFSNAGKNGILLVKLGEEQVSELLLKAQTIPGYELNVSLEDQTVTDGEGFVAKFEVDPFRKFCLLEGLDDIGLTLRHAAELDKYESQHDGASWLKAK